MDGTIIVVQVSELTSFIVKSNGDLPHLTARLSVFTRVVTNRFLHVSPQDCVVLISGCAMQE